MSQIKFNVGGRFFKCNRETILSIPDTLLSNMIADVPAPPAGRVIAQPRGQNTIFIDRNPDVFSIVLDLYRHKRLVNHKAIDPQFLRMELEFYGLDDFVYTQPAVTVLPPKIYRKLNMTCPCCFAPNSYPNIDRESCFIHPDVETKVSFTQTCKHAYNNCLHLLSELRVNPGTVQYLTLHIANNGINNTGGALTPPQSNFPGTTADATAPPSILLYSELTHFIKHTKMSKVVLTGEVGSSWSGLVVEALKNTQIEEFEMNIKLDAEAAHRICDSLDTTKTYKDKKVTLKGISDQAAKNALARRPFYIM